MKRERSTVNPRQRPGFLRGHVARSIHPKTGIFVLGRFPCVRCGEFTRCWDDADFCARCDANVAQQSRGQIRAFAFCCLLAAVRNQWEGAPLPWVWDVLDHFKAVDAGRAA